VSRGLLNLAMDNKMVLVDDVTIQNIKVDLREIDYVF